jgi:hypothetical protein
MKKKTMVLGSLLTVFIMLLIPSVNAVEYTNVKETVESSINAFQMEYKELDLNTILSRLFQQDLGAVSLNLKDAMKELFISIMSVAITIFSIFMTYSAFLNSDGVLVLIWILNTIIWTIDAILYFKGFIDELQNPVIC